MFEVPSFSSENASSYFLQYEIWDHRNTFGHGSRQQSQKPTIILDYPRRHEPGNERMFAHHPGTNGNYPVCAVYRQPVQPLALGLYPLLSRCSLHCFLKIPPRSAATVVGPCLHVALICSPSRVCLWTSELWTSGLVAQGNSLSLIYTISIFESIAFSDPRPCNWQEFVRYQHSRQAKGSWCRAASVNIFHQII